MEAAGGAMELFAKGGVVMVVLFLLSIYALGIVLYKAWQFWQWRVLDQSFVAPAMRQLQHNEPDRALTMLQQHDTPLSRVMQTALTGLFDETLNAEKRQAEIQRVASLELGRMESFLRSLEMTAQTAPLLGLLGTVTGMIEAFSRLEGGGSHVDPSILAGGIWEALLTTVGGLTVAVPSLMLWYLLDAIVEKTRAAMQDASVRILSLETLLLYSDVAAAPALPASAAGDGGYYTASSGQAPAARTVPAMAGGADYAPDPAADSPAVHAWQR